MCPKEGSTGECPTGLVPPDIAACENFGGHCTGRPSESVMPSGERVVKAV